MEITKFRVKNYRSIVDSGDCYFSPKITVLAGQNEAGKTSLLQALEDFSTNNEIRKDAIPIDREVEPEIFVTIQIAKNELVDILSTPIIENVDKEFYIITISKTRHEGYKLAEFDSKFPAVKKKKEELEIDINQYLDEISEYINDNKELGTFNWKIDQDIVQELKSAKSFVENAIKTHKSDPDKSDLSPNTTDDLKQLVKQVNNYLEESEGIFNAEIKIKDYILGSLPEFVLFQTYKDRIPNEVYIDKLNESEFIQDLAEISNLDPAIIEKGQAMDKRRHKRSVNIRLNEEYKKFWNQDAANLSIDWDSELLYFWIEEDNQPYPPSLRSQGRRWHLSFYIKLTAHASEENPPVILVDDPGLYLHAKAQEDILNKFEDVAETSKILYTTHSPYLIDTQKLNRVWLVIKKEPDGTKIEKLHAGADKDTLMPILTAMGADTPLGLRLNKENQIVVEGISDYHYLQSFKHISDWNEDIDILPGTGGNTPVYIGSILFGWGIDPIFCLDPDDPHENGRKLRDEIGIANEKIIYVCEEGNSIEDVIDPSDFKKYVLEDSSIDYSSENSEYVKDEDMDKVLLAKKFYEKVYSNEDSIDLSESTLESIEILFQKIETAFNSTE